MPLTLTTIISLLNYSIALTGYVPLYPYLPPVPRYFFLLAFVVGIRWDHGARWQIPTWCYNSAATVAILYYAAGFSSANPVVPVVSAMTVMLAIRLLSEKSSRHYQQIFALSLFCLASSSLFDLSPVFLFWLGSQLLMVAMAMVFLTFHDHARRITLNRSGLRMIALAGGALPLVSLPLLILFFPIIPRTQHPLWNFLNPPLSKVSGLSEQVAPGSASALGESTTVALRVESVRLPQQELYWRGAVFNRLDDNKWGRDAYQPKERIGSKPATMTQTYYLEPGVSRYLIALDLPVSFQQVLSKRTPDSTFELSAIPAKRIIYKAKSALGGVIPTVAITDTSFYTRLPPNVSPRIMTLAEKLGGAKGSATERIKRIEAYYRNGNFTYARDNLPTGPNSLEQFLFTARRGHCEFFASTCAILLRAVNVPARIVGGYLGGSYNDMGGYYQVTEDRAHVWVEAWIEGTGWIRIDPSVYALNGGSLLGDKNSHSLFARLRMLQDTLDHAWNRTIINFDVERQMEVARHAGAIISPDRIHFRALFLTYARYLGLIILVILVITLWVRSRQAPNKRLLRRFMARIQTDCNLSWNLERQGLLQLAHHLNDPRVTEFVAVYCGAIYRDQPLTGQERKRLNDLIRSGFR